MTCELLAGRLAQDRFERGDQGPAALQRLAELHSHGAAHGVRLFGQQAESRMAAVDLGIDTDAARDESGLVGALAIDQQIAVLRGRSASRYVHAEHRAFHALLYPGTREPGGHLELALADDHRHRDSVDRNKVDGET